MACYSLVALIFPADQWHLQHPIGVLQKYMHISAWLQDACLHGTGSSMGEIAARLPVEVVGGTLTLLYQCANQWRHSSLGHTVRKVNVSPPPP